MATEVIEQTSEGAGPDGQKFEYPGTPTTCDGAEAVVWIETHISQGSGAYPITSSTTMGSGFNATQLLLFAKASPQPVVA